MTGAGVRQIAFVAGLGLSVAAALLLLSAAYFSGTAPRLPVSAAALETLKTGGSWPPTVTSTLLDSGAPPSTAQANNVSLLPRSLDPSEAPPIDISDLPPPERRMP